MRFSDGRPLTARDVVWTVTSMRNGAVISPKAASYASVASVEARDPLTVVFHLKQPDNFLLTNLKTGAMGLSPRAADAIFGGIRLARGRFAL